MGSNGNSFGNETALYALAFLIGYWLAQQQAASEIERQRESARAARQQTIHLMRLLKGGADDEA